MTRKNILDCVKITGRAPSHYEGEKTYVSTGAVDCNHIDYRQTEQVTFDNRPSRANLTVAEGDILFAKMCGTRKTLRINKVMAEHVFSTGFYAVKANESVISAELLYYLLSSEQFLTQKDQNSSGATQKALTNAGLKKIMVQVPPLNEQNDLVKKLNCITRNVEKRQEQLDFFDMMVKSRFIELFGDPKVNPKQYPVSALSEYIEFLTSGSRGWAKYCTDDGNEWFITIKNVKDCRISIGNMQSVSAPDNAEARRTKVQEGDLLISITADLGRTGVVTKEIAEHGAYINQHLTCIRLHKEILNPLYVAHFMESAAGKEQFESKNQSAVKAGLNFNSINSLRIMVPPMSIQEEFISFVAQVDKSKYCRCKSRRLLQRVASI